MSRREDKILHGLLVLSGRAEGYLRANAGQIDWIASRPFPEAAHWYKDGRLQSTEPVGEHGDVRPRGFTPAELRSIRSLQDRGLIMVTEKSHNGLSTIYEFALTKLGAERASNLQTRWGRWDLLYRDHKAGIAGLLVTAAVSGLVSLAVSLAVAAYTHK